MSKYSLINIAIVLLILLTGFVRFYPNQQNLPIGCDEFGYLNLSKAISEGNLHTNHVPRPFLNDLLIDLKDNGFHYREYAWILAPHAYHIHENSSKVINQYPLGISSLLAAIPIAYRQLFFPPLMLFLLIAFTFIGIANLKISNRKKEVMRTFIFLFAVLALTSSPFIQELTAVTSVSPTWGLLLVAGILIRKRPVWAVIAIAISVNFRLANAILLPIPMLYAWSRQGFSETNKLFSIFYKGCSILLLVAVFGGLIYMTYVSILLDSPFESTYSQIDQSFVDWDGFLTNLSFYLSVGNKWFVLNLLGVLGLIFLRVKRMLNARLFATLIGLTITTYIYFLIHEAKTPYYPYGPSLIMLGTIIYHATMGIKFREKMILRSKWFLLLVFAVILSAAWGKYVKSDSGSYLKQVVQYETDFGEYDVVWGELKSGTIEYAASTASMRYIWGSDEVRAHIMKWLQQHNFQQAIFLDDLPVSADEVYSFLESNGLNWKMLVTENFGSIIIIEDARND